MVLIPPLPPTKDKAKDSMSGQPGRGEAAARAGGGRGWGGTGSVTHPGKHVCSAGSSGFRESLLFSMQWSRKLPQIFSLIYLLGNPEFIPEGYTRREKGSQGGLQSQAEKQHGKQTSQSTW